jgi:hypothetical protein
MRWLEWQIRIEMLKNWSIAVDTHFCLKYNRPLAMTARPDEARTGRRKNCMVLFAMALMLQAGGGGGDSDMTSPGRGDRSSGLKL